LNGRIIKHDGCRRILKEAVVTYFELIAQPFTRMDREYPRKTLTVIFGVPAEIRNGLL
jgi:hypothetical protein